MPEGEPAVASAGGGEIPRFRFDGLKKVDSSWKEEVRKQREAVGAASPSPVSPKAAGAGEARATGAGDTAAAEAKGTPQGSKVFLHFLASLAQQGLMQMGEVAHPYSGQREVDLEGAQYTIELLGVLQERTKGRLSDQETRVLNEALRELRLAYVEISREVARQMQEQALKGGKGGPGGRRK